MRQPRRIAIILKELKNSENKKKLLEYWFTPPEGVQLSFNHPLNSIDEIIKIWEEKEEDFQLFWANNTDLRLPQVLINIGIMPNYPGFYYHKEDEESMKTDKNQPQEEIRDGDVEKESNPLDQKVEDLESRVSELLSKNADLTERLEKTQEHLDMILKTGYELVQVLKVLKKLIEEEKDEKKKKSLLEILILLMGRLLQEVIDPETEREDNNKPVEKAA